MKLLSTASSALYYAFIAALIASVSVYAWQNAAEVLPSLAQRTAAALPATATIGAGVGSLALIVLLEALYPLRSLSLSRWVYVDRPRGRMRGVDKLSIAQLAGVSLLGLALCASLRLPLYAAMALPLLRIALGWRSFDLASLLRAGRTRAVSSSSFGLLDSEVSADAIASQSARLRPRSRATASPSRLFFRRLYRRWYIPLGAVAVIGLTLGLVPQLGSLALMGFAAAWTIVGAATGRAASFGRIINGAWPDWGLPLAATAVTAVLGTAFIAAVWKLPVLVLAACCLGLTYASFKRSRPARVTTMNIIDTGGFGASFSPEVFGYFLRGGYGIAAIAVILFF
ncbi:ABC transporter permease [Corynebacterium tuberculostearicum]|uniref:ABC transporter permease n=1 Tax=Corynebacterium tuberculostearicum TaxID=38304 RepID=UPI002027175F|nr:ABC transporter permease [Corynebacterium tuberculostearicum]MCG7454144.1 ABC transporter permease [Corynebacterium tuberculostearicum]MCG7463664.1 ABC transporter permease [Corynebacterium tuberculostearicum]